MHNTEIVYGPIHSRRLGNSLGINILPSDGKICTFDCVYCECGYNADNLTNTKMPSSEEVILALKKKLAFLKASYCNLDSITFSGNGEPTVHPDFKKIVIESSKVRDYFYPNTAISVLTNGTQIEKKEIFEALLLVNNPILKLDSAFNKTAQLIDGARQDYSVERQVELYQKFNGNFTLQTMFLKGTINSHNIDNTSEEEVTAWLKIVKTLKPNCVMLYTIDRPTPHKNLEKIKEETLNAIAKKIEAMRIKTIVAS